MAREETAIFHERCHLPLAFRTAERERCLLVIAAESGEIDKPFADGDRAIIGFHDTFEFLPDAFAMRADIGHDRHHPTLVYQALGIDIGIEYGSDLRCDRRVLACGVDQREKVVAFDIPRERRELVFDEHAVRHRAHDDVFHEVHVVERARLQIALACIDGRREHRSQMLGDLEIALIELVVEFDDEEVAV